MRLFARYKIILGMGFGLRYFHSDFWYPFVHLNIKPSNAMRDESFNQCQDWRFFSCGGLWSNNIIKALAQTRKNCMFLTFTASGLCCWRFRAAGHQSSSNKIRLRLAPPLLMLSGSCMKKEQFSTQQTDG